MKLSRYACFLLALALIPALVGCDDEKKNAENKKKVEDQIARIPGSHNATVVVKGDVLTITNFKAEIPYAGMGVNRISVDEVLAEGVDFDAATKPGVVPVAKKVSFKNYTSSVEFTEGAGLPAVGGGSGSATSRVAAMSMGNMRMDAGALDKAMGKDISMKDLLAACMTLKVDSSSIQGYRVDVNLGVVSATVSVDKGATGEWGLLACKDLSMEGFKATALGAEVFSLGKWTIKNINIPDIFTPAMHLYDADKKAEGGAPYKAAQAYEKDLAEAFKKSPLLMQGMVLEDIQLRPMTNEPLTVKKITADLEFSQDRILIKNNVEGFVVPPAVYGKGLEGKALAKLYGKPFELSGNLDFEAVKEGPGGRITLNSLNLADKNLGGFEFSMKGAYPEGDKDVPAVPDDPDMVRLNGLNLTLKDHGALDLIFGLSAEDAKRYDPKATKESVRAEAIAAMTAEGAEGGAKQQVLDAFAKFLADSGTFTLSMAPTFPVTMDELTKVLEGAGEGLNLSVKTVPPAK